jgi:hypothetical protein
MGVSVFSLDPGSLSPEGVVMGVVWGRKGGPPLRSEGPPGSRAVPDSGGPRPETGRLGWVGQDAGDHLRSCQSGYVNFLESGTPRPGDVPFPLREGDCSTGRDLPGVRSRRENRWTESGEDRVRSFKFELYGCQMNAYVGTDATALSGAGWDGGPGGGRGGRGPLRHLQHPRQGGARRWHSVTGAIIVTGGSEMPPWWPSWVHGPEAGGRHPAERFPGFVSWRTRAPGAMSRGLWGAVWRTTCLRTSWTRDREPWRTFAFLPGDYGKHSGLRDLATDADHFCAYASSLSPGTLPIPGPEAFSVRSVSGGSVVREIHPLGQNVYLFGVDRSDEGCLPPSLRRWRRFPGCCGSALRHVHPVDFSGGAGAGHGGASPGLTRP